MKSAVVVRDLRGNRVADLVKLVGGDLLLATPYAGDPAWERAGIRVLPRPEPCLLPLYPDHAELALSDAIADALTGYDAVWFTDCPELAFHVVRRRRFVKEPRPACVIATPWKEPAYFFDQRETNLDFMRRYVRQWCDWMAPAETWPSLLPAAAERACYPKARTPRRAETSPAVTVCVPYYNHPDLLPQMLESFERQTCQDFTMIVVDDGSTLAEARTVFERMRQRYEPRGWRWVRQENAGPSSARNYAAQLAETEFVLFFDSDDCADPRLVERLLEGMLLTGDDILTVDAVLFEGQSSPFDPRSHRLSAALTRRLLWPGNSLLSTVMDDAHGGKVILLKRSLFLENGGYQGQAGIGGEDLEFDVRAALGGQSWDVIPEPLEMYRDTPGGVSKTTNTFLNHEMTLRNYRKVFAKAGLQGLELALRGIHVECAKAKQKIGDALHVQAVEQMMRGMRRVRKPSSRLEMLMVMPYGPHDAAGGGALRSAELMRHFAARHDVTMVCFNDATPKEIQRLCRRFYQVETGGAPLFGSRLPARVALLYTQAMGALLRLLGAQPWDAVLVDQIYMAQYRELLGPGLKILSEHNVESALLQRTALLQAGSAGFAASRHEARLMEEYESEVWPDFPMRCGVSAEDCAVMDRRSETGRSILAPNGCHPNTWLPQLRHDTGTVLFPASLDYAPNVDAVLYFLREIWPLLARRLPAAKLIVAGARPVPEVLALRQPGVEVIADPPRMEALAARASLLVVPLRAGGGTRIKILNGLAWGLPMVSTRLGAEGLDLEDGEHLLLRDSPEEFAGAALEVLTREALWRQLRENGRSAAERYSWSRAFEELDIEIRRECGVAVP